MLKGICELASEAPAGYEKLADVLTRAFEQAATGKGHHRHSVGQPFHEQPIVGLQELYGTGFALGQAAKKMEESQRLDHDAAVRELLGAINYLAAVVIHMEQSQPMKCTCTGPDEACSSCPPDRLAAMKDQWSEDEKVDDDGWIEWHGGECPVPVGTLVEVEHRCGDVYIARAGFKKGFAQDWSHEDYGHDGDIVRYRLLTA